MSATGLARYRLPLGRPVFRGLTDCDGNVTDKLIWCDRTSSGMVMGELLKLSAKYD